MRHELKTEPAFFQRVFDGEKTFEVRKNDRGYQAGDIVVLREWDRDRCADSFRCLAGRGRHKDNCSGYTGRSVERVAGFIFKAGFGVDLGEHVVISLLGAPQTPTASEACGRGLCALNDGHPGACRV